MLHSFILVVRAQRVPLKDENALSGRVKVRVKKPVWFKVKGLWLMI